MSQYRSRIQNLTGAFHRCFGLGIFFMKVPGLNPNSLAIRTSSTESRQSLFAFAHSACLFWSFGIAATTP